MPKGVEFDQGLADLWGWLVTEEYEQEEGYLPPSISPPILVQYQCPRCQGLFGMLEDYRGAAWQFLDTINCHWAEIT